MGHSKEKFRSEKDAKYWKSKAEEWEKQWRYEMLTNEAWRNAVLNAALAKKITYEGQNAIYELYNGEREAIRKILHE